MMKKTEIIILTTHTTQHDYFVREILNKYPCTVIFAEHDINTETNIQIIKDIKPDIIISYGVNKICERIISICPDGIINLHGGDIEKYRGLDSFLWMIKNNDYDFIVTLHRVIDRLDAGEIISQKNVVGDTFEELEWNKTKVCVQLVLQALCYFEEHGRFISRSVSNHGRYYSRIPDALKKLTIEKYDAHKILDKDKLSIFLFHGVIDKSNNDGILNYTYKHIPMDYFEHFIKTFTKIGNAMSMDQVCYHNKNKKKYPEYPFVITFDDGFWNNYSIVRPILKKYDVPCMFYITTSFIEHNYMSWIDRVEYCFNKAGHGIVCLPWNNDCISYFFNKDDMIELLEEIRINVKSDSKLDVDGFVSEMFSQCGVKEVYSNDSVFDRKMNWSQVNRIVSDELFSIGGHTHTHKNLAFLSNGDRAKELDSCFDLIKNNTGIVLKHFSYPEGLSNCYNDVVKKDLMSRGIVCCPTAIDGLNTIGTGLFDLYRRMLN